MAQQNKLHNVVEKLLLPLAIEIVSIMFYDKRVSVLKIIQHSDNARLRKIQDILKDFIQQIVEKITAIRMFSMQLTESIDISGDVCLLVFVHVLILSNIFCFVNLYMRQQLEAKISSLSIISSIHIFFGLGVWHLVQAAKE